MKIPLYALIGAVVTIVSVVGLAVGQGDFSQRRKVFQASKQLADLGDYADAVEILQPLVEAGDDLAAYTVGLFYATGGKDLKQDYAKAVSYYQKGAEKRHAASMRQLAEAYEKGLGVPANPSLAAQWYDSAATRGDALAQMRVGMMFAAGQGGRPKNTAEAYKWLTLASGGIFYDNADARRDETKLALKQLVTAMSPTDINSGEKAVRGFSAQ